MKRIGILLLTLAMLLSLAACGAKDTQTIKAEEKQGTEQTASGTAANENQPAADLQKPEDKTITPGAGDGGDKQEETKTDDTKKDEQKPDTSKKDDVKQDEQKPADTAKDTTPESKAETPNYGNGSLTTSQVKEMQRWYGVSADGQWGAGSAKAAGGRTADEAWAYYQSNKQITTPETPSGGNTGNAGNTGNTGNSGSGNTGNTGSTGSTGGGSTAPTTPSEPAKPTKANIDCAEVMRAGNEYAQSLGFNIWDGCRSYMTPIYFEEDYSDWSQAQANAAIKEMVDAVKRVSAENGRWTPEVEGWAAAVNCVARWDASAGHHEFYVYYAA